MPRLSFSSSFSLPLILPHFPAQERIVRKRGKTLSEKKRGKEEGERGLLRVQTNSSALIIHFPFCALLRLKRKKGLQNGKKKKKVGAYSLLHPPSTFHFRSGKKEKSTQKKEKERGEKRKDQRYSPFHLFVTSRTCIGRKVGEGVALGKKKGRRKGGR